MPSVAQQQNQLFAARNRRAGKPRRYFITVSQSQKSLSLRIMFSGNPLINRFVREITYSPPSLLELAGRSVIHHQVDTTKIPSSLKQRLSHAKCCPNPNCDGVYFDNLYRQVKICAKIPWLWNFYRLNSLTFAAGTGCLSCSFCARLSAWLQKLTTQGKKQP